MQGIAPPELTYGGPRLQGQATQFQQWIIYPLSSNQFWDTNSIVKIASNITTGLVDWYRSHIEVTVQVPLQYCPVGGMQIDSSAFGCINQLVMTSRGFQIQRIMQFDTLMSYLVDIGFSEWVCQSRQGQGLGYTNISTQQPISLSKSGRGLIQMINASPIMPTNSMQAVQYNYSNGYSPTLTPIQVGVLRGLLDDPLNYNRNIIKSNNLIGGTTQSHHSYANCLFYPQVQTGVAGQRQLQSVILGFGRAINLRAQYKYLSQNNQYPDTADSYPLSAPKVKNQTWNYNTMLSSGYSPSNPYQLEYITIQPDSDHVGPTDYITPHQLKGCGISGYSKPLCPQFCKGSFQPMLSPTIPQCQMSYGIISNIPFPVYQKKFRFPLPSSICGVFIPPDQFKLFPTVYYENLILQLSMNQFWMFSTGYSDVHQYDSIGMQYPIKRRWRFKQINWTWHVYTPLNRAVQDSINAAMYRPITFSSRVWQLSAQYQLPSGAYIKQTNSIPANVQSLAQVVIIFLSNQYLNYPFCRKQFRLSNNITSMQLKANGVYYPIQPIVGNAGCPQTIDQTGNNWPYYQLILLSNNFLFNTNVPLPKINIKNFAINSRIYDVTNKNTLYSATKLYNKNNTTPINQTNINLTNLNADTALGQSWFHQNRYIGKAAYTYTFEPYGYGRGFIHGVNTLNWKQFEVTFNNATINQFPKDQTQFIFVEANVLIKLQPQRAIQVLGV